MKFFPSVSCATVLFSGCNCKHHVHDWQSDNQLDAILGNIQLTSATEPLIGSAKKNSTDNVNTKSLVSQQRNAESSSKITSPSPATSILEMATDLIPHFDDRFNISDDSSQTEAPARELSDGQATNSGTSEAGFSWARFGILTASAASILAVGIFGLYLPRIFRHKAAKENSWFGRHATMIETCCNSFAAGAFWGLAVFHVLCEGIDMLAENDVGLHIGSSFYNLSYLLVFLGYMFMYMTENGLSVYSYRYASKIEGQIRKVGSGSLSINPENEAQLRRRCALIQGVCATLGLTVHSFFEGMIIGMRDSNLLILVATISVVGHKWAAAFALSQKLSFSGVSTRMAKSLISIFIVSSPIGIYVGMPVGSSGNELVVGVFNGLCAGILIYVAADTMSDISRATDWSSAVNPSRKSLKGVEMRSTTADLKPINRTNQKRSLSPSTPTTTHGSSPILNNDQSQTGTTTPEQLRQSDDKPIASTHSGDIHTDDSICNSHLSHVHDHSRHRMCGVTEAEECCLECRLTPDERSSPRHKVQSKVGFLPDNDDVLKDSYTAYLLRTLFILLGAFLIFAMMCVHLTSPGHDHSNSGPLG